MFRTSPLLVLIISLLFFAGLILSGCTKIPPHLEEMQGFSMDTYWRLLTPPLKNAQVKEIRGELVRLEHLFDRFSPESDISRINQKAGQWVEVDGTTLDLLNKAKDLAERTRGYYDPTIGPLVELWQIGPVTLDEKPWVPPSVDAIATSKALVDYQGLNIQQGTGRVQLRQVGMKLDVGGIAKGYAVDRLAELLDSWQISNVLIDFGGDFYALGQHPEGRPWRLGIRHPRQPEKVLAFLSVENKAVTTSGDYQRYRLFQGERFSHLLNPMTGFPARGLASVTVVADRGTVADALSTAVFVLGRERGMELVENWPGAGVVIIDQNLHIWVSSTLQESISFPETAD